MIVIRPVTMLGAALLLAGATVPAAGQTPPTPTPMPMPAPGTPPGTPPGGTPGARPATPPRPGPKPYADVVTKEAKTEAGLFKVHRVDNRILWEIPSKLLGKELLWVTSVEQTQTGYGYGGVEGQDRVLRFVRREDKVLMRATDFSVRAETDGALKRAVEASTLEPILQVFDIRAFGPQEAPVIDVTPLFIGEITELSVRRSLGVQRMDPNRTFIEKIKAFPQNIETKVLATFVAGGAPAFIIGGPSAGRRDPSVESVTALLHHSIVLLPEQPMKPRLGDSRVGFFSSEHVAFGDKEHRATRRSYIRRWRLEKKDPGSALSEPVKPIVYYIGREVPEKWRPYIKKGVEDWQPAFEAAGFKNAILAKDPPTAEQDPHWDAEDVRYSSIRWLPSTTENAYGPHIADPRTGEILDSDIKFYHNALNLATNWYFVQASPNDPRAQRLPLPDELLGELMRYITAHEVGHTLGLMHNMKASSAFTVEQLRNKEFTEKWGTEASIMDYGRFNYVAQPGDGARLIPKLGPYDFFAIEWGYKPIHGANPEDERPALDSIASRQVTDSSLRFGHADSSEDPSRQTEDLGSDPIAATSLGLKNIQRVMSYLIPAVGQTGDDYERLQEMFNAVVGQRTRELLHVTAMVGGVNETDYHYGRGGAVYTPVPADRQREAVRFLNANCFATPRELLRTDIVTRLESSGTSDRILSSQLSVLSSLLSESRAKRMVDQYALSGGKTYSLAQMMDDLRGGIWSELAAPKVTIDPFRRNLQRSYIQSLSTRIVPNGGSTTDLRPLSRGALQDVQVAIARALPKAADRVTRLHLQECAASIRRALDPK